MTDREKELERLLRRAHSALLSSHVPMLRSFWDQCTDVGIKREADPSLNDRDRFYILANIAGFVAAGLVRMDIGHTGVVDDSCAIAEAILARLEKGKS